MRLKQRQIPSSRSGRLHRRGVEQRDCLEERVRQKIPLLSLRDRRDHMRQEKLPPFHGNEGSAGSHTRGQTATSLRKGLLQLRDDRVVFGKEVFLVEGLQKTHHRPGEETMRLHHGSQSPLQCNALFDGDGQLSKIRNLVL